MGSATVYICERAPWPTYTNGNRKIRRQWGADRNSLANRGRVLRDDQPLNSLFFRPFICFMPRILWSCHKNFFAEGRFARWRFLSGHSKNKERRMNAISCTSLCTGVLKNMGRDSNGSPTSFRMIKRYLIDMGSKLGFFLYFFPLEKSDFFRSRHTSRGIFVWSSIIYGRRKNRGLFWI